MQELKRIYKSEFVGETKEQISNTSISLLSTPFPTFRSLPLLDYQKWCTISVAKRYNQLSTASHFNGSTDEILARYCISELCKGWPVYRDASEWKNYRSMFTEKDTYVWTTWSGGKSIEDFIKVSLRGRANGDQIMYRENGTLVDLNLAKGRAVGKMKATITQRFTINEIAVDIECDCRFIFWCKKEGNEWKVQYNRLFYEKDKKIPVVGKIVPEFEKKELEKYPEGYRYLAVAQHGIGHPILENLPTMEEEGFVEMYETIHDWLEGKEINLWWTEF